MLINVCFFLLCQGYSLGLIQSIVISNLVDFQENLQSYPALLDCNKQNTSSQKSVII